MFPPTPTPFPAGATPVWNPAPIRLWQFTDATLQVWHTAGPFVVVVQAVILIGLVLAALSLFMAWTRKLRASDHKD